MIKDFDEIFDGIREEMFYRKGECLSLVRLLMETKDIDGDVVEVGTYMGGTATLLNRYKRQDKNLYLFDTFEGLVDCGKEDDSGFIKNGSCPANFNFVELVLRNLGDSIVITKGYFPNSAPKYFKNKKFSFVHIDVDTYLSTQNCLNYFYPKMNSGGIILIHDYINSHAPGVEKAINEFIEDKQEGLYYPYNRKEILENQGNSSQICIKKI